MGMWYTLARGLCRMHMLCFHFSRVYGRDHVPREGAVLLVSNHQSFLDPVIVGHGLSREVDYMARESLFRHPFFGRLIRSVNAFPVRQGEVDIGAVKETLRRLKAGRVVLLFPEGTRSGDGRIRRFKPGLAVLARKVKAPVVPAVIDGAYEAWPRSSPVPHLFCPTRVCFGQAFAGDEIAKYRPEEFVTLIHHRMIAMQNELRRRMGKAPYDYSGQDR